MKTILIKDEQIECSFEDVLEMFEETIKFEAFKFKNKNPHLYHSNSDIEQELRIVLYNCFNRYNDNTVHFTTYFHTSIKNFVLSLITKHTRQKREDLYYEPSLNKELSDDTEDTLLDMQRNFIDTEDLVVARDIIKTLKTAAQTDIEKEIVRFFFGCKTVIQIAEKFDISRMTVYNHIEKFRDRLAKEIL